MVDFFYVNWSGCWNWMIIDWIGIEKKLNWKKLEFELEKIIIKGIAMNWNLNLKNGNDLSPADNPACGTEVNW